MSTGADVGVPSILPHSTLPDAVRTVTLALTQRLHAREYTAHGFVLVALGTREVGEPGRVGISAESSQLGDQSIAALDDVLLRFAIETLERELARRTQPRVIEQSAQRLH